MTSEAVATAGRYGMCPTAAAASSVPVAPGEMANEAPALAAACRSATESTVPAPTLISGTARAIASMARNAAGVRSVTSITCMPPRTSARARSAAAAASSIVTTGMTGESRRKCSTVGSCFMTSAPHRESCIAQQSVHVGYTDQVEVSGDRMLQTRGRQPEIERGLGLEAGLRAVQYCGRERISAADAIDYARERVRACCVQSCPRHQRCGKIMIVHAALDP